MAYRHGKPVGRITAIINHAVNKRTGERSLRFGFLDFIDDKEVVDALFDAASRWGREKGMTSIVGPMGFTDMDHEGMLTFGYDEVGTMATIYNHPYYVDHMNRLGFTQEAQWVEFLKIKKYTSRKKIREEYGEALFELVNEAYDKLYGYSPLTRKQIQYYIDIYLGIINLDLVTLVVDAEERLVAVGISIQSFSDALKKSRGRIFPTGWRHLLPALMGKSDAVDLLLIAVKPEYQNKGVNAMLFNDLIPYYIKYGFKHAETNPELLDNSKVQDQWNYFDTRQHRRRASFRKSL